MRGRAGSIHTKEENRMAQTQPGASLTLPTGLKTRFRVVDKGTASVTPKKNPHNFTPIHVVANLGLEDIATKRRLNPNERVEAPSGQKFSLRVNYTDKALAGVGNDKSKLRLAYFDGTQWVPFTASTKDTTGWTVKMSGFTDPPVSWGK
jgi:hypothetical protein